MISPSQRDVILYWFKDSSFEIDDNELKIQIFDHSGFTVDRTISLAFDKVGGVFESDTIKMPCDIHKACLVAGSVVFPLHDFEVTKARGSVICKINKEAMKSISVIQESTTNGEVRADIDPTTIVPYNLDNVNDIESPWRNLDESFKAPLTKNPSEEFVIISDDKTVSELQSSISEQDEKIDNLETTLSSLRLIINQKEEEIIHLKEENQTLMGKNFELQTTVNQLSSYSKEEEIEALKKENHELTSQLNSLKSELDKVPIEVSPKNTGNQGVYKRVEYLENELRDTKIKYDNMRSELSSVKSQSPTLQTKMHADTPEQLLISTQSPEASSNEISPTVEHLPSPKSTIQGGVESLQERLSQLKARNRELKDRYQSCDVNGNSNANDSYKSFVPNPNGSLNGRRSVQENLHCSSNRNHGISLDETDNEIESLVKELEGFSGNRKYFTSRRPVESQIRSNRTDQFLTEKTQTLKDLDDLRSHLAKVKSDIRHQEWERKAEERQKFLDKLKKPSDLFSRKYEPSPVHDTVSTSVHGSLVSDKVSPPDADHNNDSDSTDYLLSNLAVLPYPSVIHDTRPRSVPPVSPPLSSSGSETDTVNTVLLQDKLGIDFNSLNSSPAHIPNDIPLTNGFHGYESDSEDSVLSDRRTQRRARHRFTSLDRPRAHIKPAYAEHRTSPLPVKPHRKPFPHNPTSAISGYGTPYVPQQLGDVIIGDKVKFSRSGGKVSTGYIKYAGRLASRSDYYLGVELISGEGKHDGVFEGKRYFSCKPRKGVFVSFKKIISCYSL